MLATQGADAGRPAGRVGARTKDWIISRQGNGGIPTCGVCESLVKDGEIRFAPKKQPDRFVVHVDCVPVAADDAIFHSSDSISTDAIDDICATLRAEVPPDPAIPEEERLPQPQADEPQEVPMD